MVLVVMSVEHCKRFAYLYVSVVITELIETNLLIASHFNLNGQEKVM